MSRSTKSDIDRHRFARQLLIAEIGPKGQRALGEARFAKGPGVAATTAADYLERAGVRLEEGSRTIPLATASRSHSPRIALDMCNGALGALEAMRRVLGLEAQPALDAATLFEEDAP